MPRQYIQPDPDPLRPAPDGGGSFAPSGPETDIGPMVDFSRKIASPDEGGQALVQSIKDIRREIRRDLV
jgi:hypothetical protein